MTTLYMIQLGATPKGRLIEQHDMFFGVGGTINELIPAINRHWSEVKNAWHIDSYRPINTVVNQDGSAYQIEWRDGDKSKNVNCSVSHRPDDKTDTDDLKLFFLNLGGYQQGSIEEFHYKMLVVARKQSEAIKQARQTDFYKNFSYNDEETPFDGTSHIDNKMTVDVDDIYQVDTLLASGKLVITLLDNLADVVEDKNYIGYLSLKALKKLGV